MQSTSRVIDVTNDPVSGREDRTSLGGISVSKLGIGTWAWGDSLVWNYSESMDAELQNVFEVCVEQGINFFDTAEVYGLGRSEYLCGKFKREFQGPKVLKDDVALASKFAAIPLPNRLTRRGVVDACKSSLDRMGLDSMELYQLHWPGVIRNKAYVDGLADCFDQGLVKAVGVSNYGKKLLQQTHATLRERGIQLASNQIQYSLLHRQPETSGLLAACEALDVKVLAYSPLAQGLLTGKYTSGNMPTGARNRMYKKIIPTIDPLVATLKQVGARHSKSAAQVSLNWAICKGTIPIPGAKNTRQAEENAGTLGFRLTASDIAELDAASVSTGSSLPGMMRYKE